MKYNDFNTLFRNLKNYEYPTISDFCNMEFYGGIYELDGFNLDLQAIIIKIANNPNEINFEDMDVETFIEVQKVTIFNDKSEVYHLTTEQYIKIKRFFNNLTN